MKSHENRLLRKYNYPVRGQRAVNAVRQAQSTKAPLMRDALLLTGLCVIAWNYDVDPRAIATYVVAYGLSSLLIRFLGNGH